jgi:hypothetical protein
MFMCGKNDSSVINSIYSGQLLFYYNSYIDNWSYLQQNLQNVYKNNPSIISGLYYKHFTIVTWWLSWVTPVLSMSHKP